MLFVLRGVRPLSTPFKPGIRTLKNLSPIEQYDEDVQNKKIQSDPHQRKVLKNLNSVYEELKASHRDSKHSVGGSSRKRSGGLITRLFASFRPAAANIGPKGIYMYGDVGCGKTMLMDMFYKTVPPNLTKKRLHFHAFLQDMHKLIHQNKTSNSKEDAIIQATHQLSSEYDVLCLDEVAVIDVADAMILRHIWEAMYKDGITTFMTSNRHPDELYLNGVQRKSFIPAIGLIKERNHVVFLDSPTDYRKLPCPESGTYYFLSEPGSDEEGAKKHVRRWFDFFSQGEPVVSSRNLSIWGRSVPIPLSAGNKVMQLTFNELCAELRSAADYLEMCRNFPAVIVTDIPQISLEQRDLIRRFITFLDAAYDSHAKLAVTAARPFNELFNTKHLQINPRTGKVELIGSENDAGAANIDLTNFAGHEEMFAFARALSRLKQMSSAEWLDFEK